MRHSSIFLSLLFTLSLPWTLLGGELAAGDDYDNDAELSQELDEPGPILYLETAKIGKDRVWQHQVLIDWQRCTVSYLDDRVDTINVELCEPYKELKFNLSRSHDQSYWSETHVVFNKDHGVGHVTDRWGVRGSSSWQQD